MIDAGYLAKAVKMARDHWIMVHDQEPPENFDRGVRAQVVSGVPATMIVGAINIAACRLTVDYNSQWSYICGIIRNETGIIQGASDLEYELELVPSRWSRFWRWFLPQSQVPV